MGSCRCKMCGGHIHYEADASVATCEFCGTEQTIVKTDDTKKVNLFNRANALRRENEFDKAQLTYDNILIDEPNNAEAHWGICLCRYGIQYVDTKEGKKVPMCHRTAIKSIFDDLDYKETIENADVVAKRVYETEAKVIDKIQKDILSISQKEEPYDIFISYKGHDEKNNRTPDFHKAEEIYNELKKNGYRVFFSNVSLKDKDTSVYEPYIFAALMSSKVMLSIGSKKEYYESIWEKNEWYRFLSLMKDDHNKYLIPCYFDMDRNNLPNEFMALQAYDISDNGYLEGLIDRIDKLFSTREKVIIDTEQVVAKEKAVAKMSVENNIGRIGLFVNDGNFMQAYNLAEKVLDTDYTCAMAYYYKMLANHECANDEEFIKKRINLDNDKDYQKALNFADTGLKEKLNSISDRIKAGLIEDEKNKLINNIEKNIKNNKFSDAYNMLNSLDKYEETDSLKLKYKDDIYYSAVEREEKKSYNEAISILSLLGDYKDSLSKIDRMKYILKVEGQCKRCDELSTSIEKRIRRIKETRIYDDETLNNIKKSLEEMKQLELCDYSMERYNTLSSEVKPIFEKRETIKKASKIVVLSLVAVAIVVVIVVFCLWVK
ncbi:MAG: toll/interleukin-1 receptor domain-containing protein [bacterium]|nr:toll/interleukin-1 receptor domain-containing protein [bacterium]